MENNSVLDFLPPVGIPFTVELELTAENEASATKILRMGFEGGEILPGIKVKKIYRPVESPQTVASAMLIDSIAEEYSEMISSMEEAMCKFLKCRWKISNACDEKYNLIGQIRGKEVRDE